MRAAALLLTSLALGAAGCGGDESDAPEAPAASGEASDCGRIMVPGHEAVDIMAVGVDCEAAAMVAAQAEGRGRAPYEAAGFACEPTDAAGGDTTYDCTQGERQITFLYGTA